MFVAVIAGLFLGFTAIPALFRAWMIVVCLSLLTGMVVTYVLLIPDLPADDKARKGAKLMMNVGMVFSALFAISTPLRRLQHISGSSALFGVWAMFTVMTLLVAIALLCGDTAKKFFVMLDTGVIDQKNRKKVVKPGDIVLCEIKQEVVNGHKDPREILPCKDRFLHMLILGPTGCGKTSQSILPMCHQDIQNLECGMTILEPKGDLAIKVAKMAEHYGRKNVIYFDPSYKNCPKFNPLAGREVDVLENIATTFRMLNPDSPQFFLDLNEQLIRNAIKVLKRLDKDCGVEGKYATLINLLTLLQNTARKGEELANKLSTISTNTPDEAAENKEIAAWFKNDYFSERSKVYENTSGVRSQVAKLVSNEYLRDVLNPNVEKGERNQLNFDRHLAEGGVICISTAQGALRDLSRYLGYFLILSFQSAVFRRPGTEDTRRHHYLYIDEFQTYATPGFSDMLTQGRSYRVGSILATQARAQMAMGGGKDGKNFVELVSTNARNIVIYPGISSSDAEYYSAQFGETEVTEFLAATSRKKFNFITGGLDKLGHPTESVREQKKMVANFSTTALIQGDDVGNSFGEIVYSIIKNNSVQPAKVGKIKYIPMELNKKLDADIAEHMARYARESAAEYYSNEAQSGSASNNLVGDDDDALVSESTQNRSVPDLCAKPAANDDVPRDNDISAPVSEDECEMDDST
jgi:hypothetical protein